MIFVRFRAVVYRSYNVFYATCSKDILGGDWPIVWAWLEPPWAGRAAGTTAGAAAAALLDVSAKHFER